MLRNDGRNLLKSFCFSEWNLILWKWVTLCTVKILQSIMHSSLKSETCLRKLAGVAWCGGLCRAKHKMLYSELRLQWRHRTQHEPTPIGTPLIHCVLIFNAIWPASTQKPLIVADCFVICHITSYVVPTYSLSYREIVASSLNFRENLPLAVVCFH